MKQLEWIILKTNNYALSKRFYGEILGLAIVRDTPEEEFTQFKLDNCFLAIYGSKYFKQLTGVKIGTPGSAIYTFSQVSDVDSEIADLEARGVSVIKAPETQPWGQRTAYFTDPDGHIWEIQKWVN